MRVGRTWTADDVVAVIEGVVAERGAPTHRMDNGPELIAWAPRDFRLASTRAQRQDGPPVDGRSEVAETTGVATALMSSPR
jgi:hypothetical protein